MRRIVSILLLLLTTTCLDVFSQSNFIPGFIITNEFDTIVGLLDSRGEIRNSQICDFRFDASSETKRYLPGEIFGYRFTGGKYYVSKETPVGEDNIPLFLEFLVDGVADLYYYRESDGVHYYMEKDGTRLVELSNEVKTYLVNGETEINKVSNRYIGVLRAFLVDCEELQPELSTVKFTQTSLVELTENYHNYTCKEGDECINYLKEVPNFKFKLGISISAIFSSLAYNNSSGVSQTTYGKFKNISSGLSPSGGLTFLVSSARISEKVEFGAALELGKASYTGSYEELTYNLTSSYFLQKDVTSLSSLFLVNYTFNRGWIRPFAGIGIGGQFEIIEKSARTYYLEENDAIIYSEEFDDVPVSGGILLVRVQTGVKFHYFNSLVPFINFRAEFGYTQADYKTAVNAYAQNIFTLGVSGGIYF